MTKAGNTNGKSRSATFEDLRAARFRTAEVLGLGADGEAMTIHYKALSGAKVVEYLDREEDENVSQGQKYRLAVADLAENLVDAGGAPLATQEQLMELPADTINLLMKTVAGVKEAEGDEGNASGEAAGSASPTA
jgi:hypothetical protein